MNILRKENMKRINLLCLAILFAVSSSVAIAQTNTPSATIAAFYKFDKANSQVFNRKNIDARKKWFSSELYALLLNELKREAEYLIANPTDKPHFGDGLPFQPLDETCELNGKSYRRTISYGTVTVKGDIGNVDVHFKYPKSCNIPDVLYAVNMENEKGRWVISDIGYFPGDTSLVEDLNRKEY